MTARTQDLHRKRFMFHLMFYLFYFGQISKNIVSHHMSVCNFKKWNDSMKTIFQKMKLYSSYKLCRLLLQIAQKEKTPLYCRIRQRQYKAYSTEVSCKQLAFDSL